MTLVNFVRTHRAHRAALRAASCCCLVGLLVAACSSPAASSTGSLADDAANDANLPHFDSHDGGKDGTAGQDGLQDAATTHDGDLTDLGDGTDGSLDGGDTGFVNDCLTGCSDTLDAVTDAPACDFPASPAPGEPGATCKTADECDSGFCIDSPDGKICTAACISCCPAGFQCGKMPGIDVAFACLPKQLALCQPCATDAECGKVDPGALCLSYGAAGSFCGTGCAGNAACPGGYACQDSAGQLGAAKQCVRTQGACSCTKWGAFVGATTDCTQQNDLGTCKGTRKCALAGLTACSAPAPATETCNGVDDNCDGVTDPANAAGCTLYFTDNDGDGFGGGKGSCLCTDSGLKTTVGGDCNDQSLAIHPGAKEICDGLDNDCDGQTDPGFPDSNSDGFADCVDPDIDGDGVVNVNDCAPANAAIFPGAKEICDGLDNDCNGVTDDAGATGCTLWFQDNDGDGSGAGLGQCLCDVSGKFTAATGGDCNDSNGAIHPGATEVCNDADDNCNGASDEGCDDDLDLWCDATMTVVGAPSVCASGKQDCNDAAGNIHPGQAEVCGNGIDDNCDGLTDTGDSLSGCIVYYVDNDGDGYGDKSLSQCLCAASSLYTTQIAGDCNDTDAKVNPKAQEVCNGKDDDCDGVTDGATAAECKLYFNDADGDTFGVTADQKCQCGPIGTYTATAGGDCNDGASAIHPGVAETCNGIDDDCDGLTDPANTADCAPYYKDSDGDGYGSYQGGNKCLCAAISGYVSAGGDCDDTKAAVHPNATEICNGIDDNCDNAVDPLNTSGCTAYHIDADGDAFGQTFSQCACAADGFYTALNGDDCDDTNAKINPKAVEICDGQDNNCDGATDEGVQGTYFADADLDGYGVGSGNAQCKPTTPFSATLNGDCDDANKAVNPGASETCNQVDDNCNGATDEGLPTQTYFADGDKDGYGAGLGQTRCAPSAGYPATLGTDCADSDPAIHPGATETCNLKDDNCNGQTDEGATPTTWYADSDKDGYGNPSASQVACGAPAGYVADNTDCDDTSAAVKPGALETCNGKDDNCNGATDEGGVCTVCAATVLNGFNSAGTFTSSAKDWVIDSSTKFAPTEGGNKLRWGNNNDSSFYAFDCGYYATTADKATWTVLIPNDATFVAIDYAFYNASGTNQADTGLNMTLTMDGVSFKVGPYGALQSKTWRTIAWPVSSAQRGTTVTMTATVNSPSTSNGCDGPVAIDNVRSISGCADPSAFCGGPSGGASQQTWYADADGDGYGAGAAVTGCIRPVAAVSKLGDCNDTNAAVHPGASEVACNGLDDNCDGNTDEGTLLNGMEQSGDISIPGQWWLESYNATQGASAGWWGSSSGCSYATSVPASSTSDTTVFSVTIPANTALLAVDVLFDNRLKVSPLTPDTTARMIATVNGVKRQVGPFATVQTNAWRTLTWPMTVADVGKTYDVTLQVVTTQGSASGVTCVPGHVGGFGVDNARALTSCTPSGSSCTPGVAASTWYLDADGDGYGDTASPTSNCIQPSGYAANGGDCDDANAAVNPGVAKDTCATAGIDDNCDGVTDATGATSCTPSYVDADHDGYGTGATTTCVCAGTVGYAATKTDCNDANAAIHPGIADLCATANVDDNCDGTTDGVNSTGCATYYGDADADGYGGGAGACLCKANTTYTTLVAADCNDAVKSINPGATETCNAIDDNCNGATDEGLPQGTWYRDADGDGYRNPDPALVIANCLLPGYVTSTAPDDCLDSNAAVHAGAPEVCYDGLDNNCDGVTDEGCAPCTGAVLNGFESMLNITRTGTQWGVLATPHTEGTNALGWSSLFNGGGNGYYSTSGSGEYMYVSATIPTGTAFVKADIYVGNRSLSAVDTNMVVTPTLGGTLPVGGALGPYSTYQGSNSLKTVVWAVTPSQWNTPVQFKVNVSTNVTSADPLGYVMVDNLRTTCN